MVSCLCCKERLRLTACNRYIKALKLERGLLTMRVGNLSSARLCQHYIDWVCRCNLLLELDMSYPCQPTDAVVQGIVEHNRHLLVIDLADSDLVTDQAVHAVARHCPSLIMITLGTAYPKVPRISDEAVQSIAHYCRQLVAINLDDTNLTDDGAHALASSCHRLRYASVGGTCISPVGAIALAQRCTLACERADTHVEKTAIHIYWPLFNLCLDRVDNDVDAAALRRRFSRISIFD